MKKECNIASLNNVLEATRGTSCGFIFLPWEQDVKSIMIPQ